MKKLILTTMMMVLPLVSNADTKTCRYTLIGDFAVTGEFNTRMHFDEKTRGISKFSDSKCLKKDLKKGAGIEAEGTSVREICSGYVECDNVTETKEVNASTGKESVKKDKKMSYHKVACTADDEGRCPSSVDCMNATMVVSDATYDGEGEKAANDVSAKFLSNEKAPELVGKDCGDKNRKVVDQKADPYYFKLYEKNCNNTCTSRCQKFFSADGTKIDACLKSVNCTPDAPKK